MCFLNNGVLVISTPYQEKEAMYYSPFQENYSDAQNDCLPPAETAAEGHAYLIKMKFLFFF